MKFKPRNLNQQSALTFPHMLVGVKFDAKPKKRHISSSVEFFETQQRTLQTIRVFLVSFGKATKGSLCDEG
jgi:hypothetical protein